MTADLRALAEELAIAAGSLALAGRRGLGVGQPAAHDTKSTATDPVTEFDRAAERLIVQELRRRRPDDGIVGEEGTAHPGTSGIVWHLDPIDGTVNFVYDLPSWCTSIGAVDAMGSVAGAVYVPVVDELYSAGRGSGATLNASPITVSSCESVELALVGTGFSYDAAQRHTQARRAARLLPKVRDIRRQGSAALDMCLVACGRLDAYYEEHLNTWDMAAGTLIATEAGAAATDLVGGPASTAGVVIASVGLHSQLIDLLMRVDGDADGASW